MPSNLSGSMGALLGGNAAGGPNQRPAPTTASGPSSPTGPAAGALGAGMDAVNQELMARMQQVRQIGDAVTQLGATLPEVADEVTQIQQLLKAIVVKAAGAVAPMQSASSTAVPGNGGGA